MKKKQITEDLIHRITGEELLPGHWLVERELSDRYGLSRTPIREILRDLSTTGLVEWLPARGYRVREMRLEDCIELFAAREAVEGMAARLASQSPEEDFFARLESLGRSLATVDITTDPAAGVRHGRDLHDGIID
ncbi:MAG: GntR family transcriptional regulator, partial [Planctomycetes bacterium]|nr:GntR family transcriptional regulator [Planctomycetota bacterium]